MAFSWSFYLAFALLCFIAFALPLTSAASSQRLPLVPSTSPAQQGTMTGGQKVWCIAKPASDEANLMQNIAFACEQGGLDCSVIQPRGACYLPNTAIAHASYVMNMYYQKNQRNWWTCHFNGTGLVVFADPSFGACTYAPQ